MSTADPRNPLRVALDRADRFEAEAAESVAAWRPDDPLSTMRLAERLDAFAYLAARALCGRHADLSVEVLWADTRVDVEVECFGEVTEQVFRWSFTLPLDVMDEQHDLALTLAGVER